MIRNATMADMPSVLHIYEVARTYMREHGNPNQWGNNNPPQKTLEEDIRRGELYVVCSRDGAVHGAFAFIRGEDPTYAVIEGGSWRNEEPYGTIHRVGSDGTMKGIFAACIQYCKELSDNIRVDTHEDNKTMQHLLQKHGFQYCGIIYTDDGTPRFAYQYLKEEQ